MDRNEILNCIKDELKKKISAREADAVELPSDIGFDKKDGAVVLTLSAAAAGVCENRKKALNMQSDSAAFEGWALVVYTYYAKRRGMKIRLALGSDAWQEAGKYAVGSHLGKRGHYYRFLYRVLRFSQQYKWFETEERLGELAASFDAYLKSGIVLTNNYPDGDKAASDSGRNDENHIEDLFSDPVWQESPEGAKLCGGFGTPIYRQLPVGLFVGEKSTENALFTRGKSAIDLWCHDERSITIFELKWKKNKKIGILTEIFFYSNYMRDMFGKKEEGHGYGFKPFTVDPAKIRKKYKYRGYHEICNNKYEQINAYMLYDPGTLHQAITDDLTAEMNRTEPIGMCGIKYGRIEYTAEEDVLKITTLKSL